MKRQKQQETKKVEWWLDSHMLGQSARAECGGWTATCKGGVWWLDSYTYKVRV